MRASRGFLKWGILLTLVSLLWIPPSWANMSEPLRRIPVLDAGRIKPFDTFANESLHLLYGRQTFKGKAAPEIVFSWMLVPDHWDKIEFVEVRHSGVREALGLEGRRIHYAPEELFRNERLPLIFTELRTQQEQNPKLNPYFQAVQRLENQLTLYQVVKLGRFLGVAPIPGEDSWAWVIQLTGDLQGAFQRISLAFAKAAAYQKSPDNRLQGEEERERRRLYAEAIEEMNQAVDEFVALARAEDPGNYVDPRKLSAELHYNSFEPFMWSWILYVAGALLMLLGWNLGSTKLYKLAWAAILGGFMLHTYGQLLRSYITGRPPVSNMYETVVWVPWGIMVLAMIWEWMYRNKVVLIVGAVVSAFSLILTFLSPTVLDPSLQPLEPVLVSNFWLITHVLVITISYAGFFLAFGLGDLSLWYHLRDEKKYAKSIQDLTQAMYRAIQFGVVLLAAGTILGGIWADYSWGRYWGWDPKETWALIALLGYLALLHGRLVGWVKNFGMAAGSVLAFSLVIMAWYGVNFVLGAGLHSYGFGAGGVEWVSGFVAIHVLYVGYVTAVRRLR